MIALRMVRLIETHSDELTAGLLSKFRASSRTADLDKVPPDELRERAGEILFHLSDWLLNKTEADVEQRYREIGSRRASQGVSLSDLCWSMVMTKEHLWGFLQSRGLLNSVIDIYGQLELLRMLDQFFDRALCFATEGYLQVANPHPSREAHVA
jgi:hypothetical protein